MICGVVTSGASVTSVRPPVSEVRSPSALASRSRSFARSYALARYVEERALDVNPEHARHAGLEGAAHRGDGARHHVEVGADEGRKESGGAEAAVGAADGADRLDGRGIVEEHAAAAVDLRVDEAGQQQLAAEIAPLRAPRAPVRGGDDIEYAAVLDEHASALREPVLEQHPAVDQGNAHQRVSVTLARCGGWSGSPPRASARALTIR